MDRRDQIIENIISETRRHFETTLPMWKELAVLYKVPPDVVEYQVRVVFDVLVDEIRKGFDP